MFDMLTKTYSKVIGYQFAPIIVILIFKQKRVEIFCYRGKSVRVKELTTELGRGELISGASLKRNLTGLDCAYFLHWSFKSWYRSKVFYFYRRWTTFWSRRKCTTLCSRRRGSSMIIGILEDFFA